MLNKIIFYDLEKQGLTGKDQDKDKDQTHKDQDMDQD